MTTSKYKFSPYFSNMTPSRELLIEEGFSARTLARYLKQGNLVERTEEQVRANKRIKYINQYIVSISQDELEAWIEERRFNRTAGKNIDEALYIISLDKVIANEKRGV